jgi:beta-N-acetylhexosaminidase
LAGQLTLNQRIGQLFMAGTSSTGMSSSEAARLAALKVGSVLPLGNTTAGRAAVRRVTDDIRSGVGSHHGVKLMLAADQEGGLVQRLAGPGFDTIPSAEQQSRLSTGELQRRAERWGRQLKRAGIDVNLAPVADVVPTSVGAANQPIGALHRGYGPNPQHVAADDVAFIRGMHAAHVGATVKHFPGLGVVTGNTDTTAHVTDTRTTRHGARLAGFRAGARAGVDMEMVSSAVYTRIDPKHPATYSPTVIQGMLRGDLGFRGVIISDDLMGKALGSVPVHDRALRFIRTGGDLAIVGDPGSVAPMVHAVRAAAAHDQQLRRLILDSATRVLTLKSRYGLADCG